MKIKAFILVAYLSILMFSQALCGLCSAMEQIKASNNIVLMNSHSKIGNSDKLQNNLCCCSIQCQCFFQTVSPLHLVFYPLVLTNKVENTNNQFTSNYLSSFWHPPKLV